MTAYLSVLFLILLGGFLGGALVFLWQHKREGKARIDYNVASAQLLDMRKEMSDLTLESLHYCADSIKELYRARQDDVLLYVNGTNAALQLVNELMGKVNELMTPNQSHAVTQMHLARARQLAEEMRRILAEIKFAELPSIVARLNQFEAESLKVHEHIENQRTKAYGN